MLRYKRIVFVSEDGLCKAPLAAAIFNREIPEKEYQAQARGLVVLFPEPANPKAVAVAKSRGLDLEDYRAKGLSASDFGEDVLVLVPNDKKKARIYNDFKEATNVFTMSEFAEDAMEVGDPYGEDLQAYGIFFERLEAAIQKIIYKLYKEDPGSSVPGGLEQA